MNPNIHGRGHQGIQNGKDLRGGLVASFEHGERRGFVVEVYAGKRIVLGLKLGDRGVLRGVLGLHAGDGRAEGGDKVRVEVGGRLSVDNRAIGEIGHGRGIGVVAGSLPQRGRGDPVGVGHDNAHGRALPATVVGSEKIAAAAP